LEIDYYEKDKELKDKLIPTTLFHTYTLVTNWLKEEIIEGVYVMEKITLEENLEQYSNWASPPRVIPRKNKTTVECMFDLKTTASTFQLYQNQKDMCNSKSIKISTKKTDMQYMQKIGFLTGPYVQLAAPDRYVQEINEEALICHGAIEIKKRITFEKGVASKVLMVYTIIDEASQLDRQIFNAKYKVFKYVSYKLLDSDQCLAAIHNNEMTNVKARFETLYNTNLKETIYKVAEQTTIQEAILNAKHNDNDLFLAIEQGSGKFKDHS